MGFGAEIHDFSLKEMWELWIDRVNRKGFEFEKKENGHKIYKSDYIYFWK